MTSNGESLLDQLLREQDKRSAEKSLLDFIRQGWRFVEPADFQTGWHIEAICDHLEAVAHGEILRLVINMPPRHMKSLGLNVFFPAWVWAQDPDPKNIGHGMTLQPNAWMGAGVKFMHIAFDGPLATRDSVKCRDLIRSPWYQKNWGDRIQLKRDQNEKTRFDNLQGGHRIATPAAGVIGEGADIIPFDDPHDTKKVESTREREELLRFWDEGIQSRLNNRERGVFIVNMQRLDYRDLTGHILAKELNAVALHGPSQRKWVHICLPARFEADHPTPMRTPVLRKSTGELWKDPRAEGEPLWPARFSEKALDDLAIEFNSTYAVAGQLQQRPVPRAGGMFQRSWFEKKIIGAPDCPIKDIPKGTRFVRHWDLAATDKSTAAFTAGVKLGKMPDGNFVVAHVIRVQKEGPEVRKLIKATAATDGRQCRISLPKDPGQAGKVQAGDFVRDLAGYNVVAEAETGSKEVRAEPISNQAAVGNLYLMQGPWNDAFLDECVTFPNGKTLDQVDALANAFAQLNDGKGETSSGMVAGLH